MAGKSHGGNVSTENRLFQRKFAANTFVMKISSKIVVASIFIWIGFICAISFMEAWLKFQAPGITLPLGLGIGKLVFVAMNKVEWLLGILVLICLIWEKTPKYYFFAVVMVLLSFQTFWVLPELNMRADAIINGAKLPPSKDRKSVV